MTIMPEVGDTLALRRDNERRAATETNEQHISCNSQTSIGFFWPE